MDSVWADASGSVDGQPNAVVKIERDNGTCPAPQCMISAVVQVLNATRTEFRPRRPTRFERATALTNAE